MKVTVESDTELFISHEPPLVRALPEPLEPGVFQQRVLLMLALFLVGVLFLIKSGLLDDGP
jgi:hypothetical protein